MCVLAASGCCLAACSLSRLHFCSALAADGSCRPGEAEFVGTNAARVLSRLRAPSDAPPARRRRDAQSRSPPGRHQNCMKSTTWACDPPRNSGDRRRGAGEASKRRRRTAGGAPKSRSTRFIARATSNRPNLTFLAHKPSQKPRDRRRSAGGASARRRHPSDLAATAGGASKTSEEAPAHRRRTAGEAPKPPARRRRRNTKSAGEAPGVTAHLYTKKCTTFVFVAPYASAGGRRRPGASSTPPLAPCQPIFGQGSPGNAGASPAPLRRLADAPPAKSRFLLLLALQ